MPISISEAQKKYISSGSLEGEDRSGFVEFGISKNVFEQYGIEFLRTMAEIANNRKVVASGEILSKSKYKVSEDGTVMQILVPDYFDFPNLGVKGVKSSRNAPQSPYKYKTYGMNEKGRNSLRAYIQSGHAKIKTVARGDRALGIGREKKHLSLLDAKVNTLAFMIKRQGIKATKYFDDAMNLTFGDEFALKMAEAVGQDIVYTLSKIKK